MAGCFQPILLETEVKQTKQSINHRFKMKFRVTVKKEHATSCTDGTHATIPAACCMVLLCIQPQAQIVRGYDTVLQEGIQACQAARCCKLQIAKPDAFRHAKQRQNIAKLLHPHCCWRAHTPFHVRKCARFAARPPPPNHHCALHISAVALQIHSATAQLVWMIAMHVQQMQR